MKNAFVALAFLGLVGAVAAEQRLASTSQDVEPVIVTEKNSDRAYLSVGGWGELSMNDNGCLVVGDQSLMIWSAGTKASRTEDGRIQVVDGATGKIVYAGETIGFGGGGAVGRYPDDWLAEPSPEVCADLPSWTMGAFIETAAELREVERRKAQPLPIMVPDGSVLITEWNEYNIFELTRSLFGQFGNRIYDLDFVGEPTAHIVVKLAGDSAVPNGHHHIGTFVVEARFETGATESMGEVVDGLWVPYAEPRVRELPTIGNSPGTTARPIGVPEGQTGWGEPSESDTAQLVRRIRRDQGHRLAGLWTERDPLRVNVRLTGDEPVQSELLQIYGFAVEVQYRVGATHTVAELQEVLTGASETIQRYLPTAHSRYVDERTGEVAIAIDFGDEVAKRNQEALSAELGVQVRVTEQPRATLR